MDDGYQLTTYPWLGGIRVTPYHADGYKHGIARCWDIEDNKRQLSDIATYRHGKLHGLEVMYHSNGRINWKSTYRHGKLHGSRTSYSPNGIIESESNWVDGELHGWAIHYEHGRIVERTKYEHGQKILLQIRNPPDPDLPEWFEIDYTKKYKYKCIAKEWIIEEE